MNSKKLCCICVLFSLLAGCASESSIDEKKKKAQVTQSNINKNTPQQLTDKDLFGNETTLAVSEEEMRKYYTVSTFSGIPDRQKPLTCNKNKDKNENEDVASAENMNWMQALRFVAAKGHQKAIIVYQDMLQTGKYDSALKSTVWSDYKNDKLTDAISLRYLVRFTLVDVATGEWATWSPVNYEYKVLPPLPDKNEASTTDMTEQQIMQLKQKTYKAMVKDLVNRYQ